MFGLVIECLRGDCYSAEQSLVYQTVSVLTSETSCLALTTAAVRHIQRFWCDHQHAQAHARPGDGEQPRLRVRQLRLLRGSRCLH